MGQILTALPRIPLGLMGLIIVGAIVFSAVFAAWIVPYDPVAMNVQGPDARARRPAIFWALTSWGAIRSAA